MKPYAPMLLSLALATAASAQQGAVVRPRATIPPQALADRFRKLATPPAADGQKKDDKIIYFTPVQTVPWAALAAMVGANAEAMKGWTPLTNGASQGGAAVYQDGKTTSVLVRAADDYLYATTIDPLNPGGPLAGSAWAKTSISASSEPHCQHGTFGDSKDALCAFLGPDGSARIAWFSGAYAKDGENLGGHDAGARPTVGPQPHSFSCHCDIGGSSNDKYGYVKDYILYVWDGKKSLFRRQNLSYSAAGYYGLPTTWQDVVPANAGWKRLAGEFGSPVGCAEFYNNAWSTVCAVINGNGVSRFDATALSTDKMQGMAFGKPIPGGANNRTAPVLLQTKGGASVTIVRNAAGRLYRSVDGGAWMDEGGAAKVGSQISCIVNQEQPTCFIQGYDGRVYWKRLGTAGGL